MDSIRFVYILVLVWAVGIPEAVGQEVSRDSLVQELRTPPASFLDVYRSDPAFQYDGPPPEDMTWWDRLKQWFWDTIFGPAISDEYRPIRRFLLFCIIAIVLFFALTRILQMQGSRALYKGSPKQALTFDEFDGEIETVDVDALLQRALEEKAYRKAVRYQYLRVLQVLTLKALIQWRAEKTNREYVRELRGHAIQPLFAEITTLFEYAWYGDFALDAGSYQRFAQDVAVFQEKINGDTS